ncbi:unnamed protein product, partial [Nesidiocoris tenuis]
MLAPAIAVFSNSILEHDCAQSMEHSKKIHTRPVPALCELQVKAQVAILYLLILDPVPAPLTEDSSRKFAFFSRRTKLPRLLLKKSFLFLCPQCENVSQPEESCLSGGVHSSTTVIILRPGAESIKL